MGIVSKLARWAPRLTQATGILLILLGTIHLVVTPFLNRIEFFRNLPVISVYAIPRDLT
jgi:hypothetical protein